MRVMRALACSKVSSLVVGPNQMTVSAAVRLRPWRHAFRVRVEDLDLVGVLEGLEDVGALAVRGVAADGGEVELGLGQFRGDALHGADERREDDDLRLGPERVHVTLDDVEQRVDAVVVVELVGGAVVAIDPAYAGLQQLGVEHAAIGGSDPALLEQHEAWSFSIL